VVVVGGCGGEICASRSAKLAEASSEGWIARAEGAKNITAAEREEKKKKFVGIGVEKRGRERTGPGKREGRENFGEGAELATEGEKDGGCDGERTGAFIPFFPSGRERERGLPAGQDKSQAHGPSLSRPRYQCPRPACARVPSQKPSEYPVDTYPQSSQVALSSFFCLLALSCCDPRPFPLASPMTRLPFDKPAHGQAIKKDQNQETAATGCSPA
jgi:hypothetical protein